MSNALWSRGSNIKMIQCIIITLKKVYINQIKWFLRGLTGINSFWLWPKVYRCQQISLSTSSSACAKEGFSSKCGPPYSQNQWWLIHIFWERNRAQETYTNNMLHQTRPSLMQQTYTSNGLLNSRFLVQTIINYQIFI